MRKKSLKRVTISVIIFLIIIILCWALIKSISAPSSRHEHDHSVLFYNFRLDEVGGSSDSHWSSGCDHYFVSFFDPS